MNKLCHTPVGWNLGLTQELTALEYCQILIGDPTKLHETSLDSSLLITGAAHQIHLSIAFLNRWITIG